MRMRADGADRLRSPAPKSGDVNLDSKMADFGEDIALNPPGTMIPVAAHLGPS
jgi:hypothetical protein